MLLALIILVIIVFGITLLLLNGRNIRKTAVPFFILLIINFLLLYTKFLVGDYFLSIFLHLPLVILLLVLIIWLTKILVNAKKNKATKKMLVAVMSIVLSVFILFIPPIKEENKFKLFHKDFFAVSKSIFQAHDEGKLIVGDFFSPPPYIDKYNLNQNDIFPVEVIKRMKKLKSFSGIYTYIIANENVVYFCYGASLQSISGIAISRNGYDPSTDDALRKKYFDGAIHFKYIMENVYFFEDGL